MICCTSASVGVLPDSFITRANSFTVMFLNWHLTMAMHCKCIYFKEGHVTNLLYLYPIEISCEGGPNDFYHPIISPLSNICYTNGPTWKEKILISEPKVAHCQVLDHLFTSGSSSPSRAVSPFSWPRILKPVPVARHHRGCVPSCNKSKMFLLKMHMVVVSPDQDYLAGVLNQ